MDKEIFERLDRIQADMKWLFDNHPYGPMAVRTFLEARMRLAMGENYREQREKERGEEKVA